MRRRQRVADLVFQTGAHALDDAELESLLREHVTGKSQSPEARFH